MYHVSLENVADQSFLKLFELKPEQAELQNPLFVNWMVELEEKQYSIKVQKAMGSDKHGGCV